MKLQGGRGEQLDRWLALHPLRKDDESLRGGEGEKERKSSREREKEKVMDGGLKEGKRKGWSEAG